MGQRRPVWHRRGGVPRERRGDPFDDGSDRLSPQRQGVNDQLLGERGSEPAGTVSLFDEVANRERPLTKRLQHVQVNVRSNRFHRIIGQ
jgi:hypothetical protein